MKNKAFLSLLAILYQLTLWSNASAFEKQIISDSTPTQSEITLIYKDGQKYIWHTDTNHPTRSRIERGIDNYFKGDQPCYDFSGEKHCDLFLSLTNRFNSKKTSTRVIFDLENIAIVMIKDINFTKYNDAGTSCKKTLNNGTSKYHVDTLNFLRLNINAPAKSSISNHERFQFVGARKQSSGSNFTTTMFTLIDEWITYKNNPNHKPKLKWELLSHCLFSKTTLYIPDFNLVDSLSYKFPEDRLITISEQDFN